MTGTRTGSMPARLWRVRRTGFIFAVCGILLLSFWRPCSAGPIESSDMPSPVLIYSTPTCPYCKMAKAYFKEHHIEYTDFDASADAVRAEEMQKKSGQLGVPVIDINGTIIVGFDKPKLEAALKEKGLM